MKMENLGLFFKSLMLCSLVVILMTTGIFANDLNDSCTNNSVNNGNSLENSSNENDHITKARYEREKAHKDFDNELLKLAKSNESSDKELAKKIWNSIKKYQDHSIVLYSPALVKMKEYLNLSDSEFKLIYAESCISGKRYSELLKYVKSYNKNNIKINEFKINFKLLKKDHDIYIKKLRKEKNLLKKWGKKKKNILLNKKYNERKKKYKRFVIKIKKFKLNLKLKKSKYNSYLNNSKYEKEEFEKQYNERENIFKNESEYLKNLGMNDQMFELLNIEFNASTNYLKVCQKYC